MAEQVLSDLIAAVQRATDAVPMAAISAESGILPRIAVETVIAALAARGEVDVEALADACWQASRVVHNDEDDHGDPIADAIRLALARQAAAHNAELVSVSSDYEARLTAQTAQAADNLRVANRIEGDANIASLESNLAATQRELERWRHGETVAEDFVCPDTLRADESDKSWLAIMRAIEAVDPDVETNWAAADDETVAEQYDPWETLRRLTSQRTAIEARERLVDRETFDAELAALGEAKARAGKMVIK